VDFAACRKICGTAAKLTLEPAGMSAKKPAENATIADVRLMTVAEVADWLNVHPDTVRRYERQELIDSVVLNESPKYRTIRFEREAVARFIRSRARRKVIDEPGVQKIDRTKLSVRKFSQ
jgi:hypothetical protein